MGGRYSYGSFDEMVANLERALSSRSYIAGDSFTSADVQIASGVHYAIHVLRVLPEKPVFKDYLERVLTRPAYQRATALDAELAQSMTGSAD
jgi:glutathione S-transferase